MRDKPTPTTYSRLMSFEDLDLLARTLWPADYPVINAFLRQAFGRD